MCIRFPCIGQEQQGLTAFGEGTDGLFSRAQGDNNTVEYLPVGDTLDSIPDV